MSRIIIYILPAFAIIGGLWVYTGHERATSSYYDPSRASITGKDPSRTIITVNGEAITEGDFTAALASLPPKTRNQMATPGGKKSVGEQLVQLVLLAQEARKMEIEREPRFQTNLELQETSMLANAAMARITQRRLGSIMKQIYERNPNHFSTIKARQIVLGFDGSRTPPKNGEARTREEAIEKGAGLVSRIRAGESFVDVARDESDDPSASRGGEIGVLNRADVAPGRVRDTLFSLEAGQVSNPVDSPDGVHIFMVDEKLLRSFADVREILQREATQLLSEEIVRELRDGAQVVFDEEFFALPRQLR